MLRSARPERKTLTEVALQELRQSIKGGIFRPGSQLPTEAELCAMLGVSRTVVREALRVLEDDGLVARRHGVGTFVRNQPIVKNLNFNFGITEMIESAGLKSGTSFLAFRKEAADEEKVKQLKVALGTPLITVERVRTADGRPVVYSFDTLTEALFQKADFDPQVLGTESIYPGTGDGIWNKPPSPGACPSTRPNKTPTASQCTGAVYRSNGLFRC